MRYTSYFRHSRVGGYLGQIFRVPACAEPTSSFWAAAFVFCAAGVASAQSYPTKPIRIVTNEPGGGLDFALRMMTPALSSGLGQQVIVDNRGGAGGQTRAVNRVPACGM